VIVKDVGSGGSGWEVGVEAGSTVGVEGGDAESGADWEVDVEVGLTVWVRVGIDLSLFAVSDV
jgi:hypothetical protein